MESPSGSSVEWMGSLDKAVASPRAGFPQDSAESSESTSPRGGSREGQMGFARNSSKVHTFYEVFYGEAVIGSLVFNKNYWV